MKPILIYLILLVLCSPVFTDADQPRKEIVLADFENGIPCSEEGDIIGFRKKEKIRATIVEEGAEGSRRSATFIITPQNGVPEARDLFFQGVVRRMYLPTKSTKYDENGPNALSFWIKLKPDSLLISKEDKNTFGVWTYHWRFGDLNVGGSSNNELATDSMMHGYSNFRFNEKAAGRWVRVILSSSAFQQSRYYYHFYAAQGITDDLKFFPSLRQLQFHIFQEIKKEGEIQIDQLRLIHLEPTAIIEKEFFSAKVSKDIGDVEVPVIIKNPTGTDRRYRVFISSFLGVHRNVLYDAHALTDSFAPPRAMQAKVGGDGGIGVVKLINEDGDSVIDKGKEIFVPAKGLWKGKLVHKIRPEMLGAAVTLSHGKYTFIARRDTLTTSVIIWDPYDETAGAMDYINVSPSNADDAKHNPPLGFPKQKSPPEGWRSENIPINQVGGYFVSVIQLTD